MQTIKKTTNFYNMYIQRTVFLNVQMFQMSYDGFLVNGMPGTGKTPIERLLIGVFSTWYLGSIAGVIWAHYAECSNLIINPKLMQQIKTTKL